MANSSTMEPAKSAETMRLDEARENGVPWLDLRTGYRSLNVSYQASGSPLGFNVHMKGPIIGATLRF